MCLLFCFSHISFFHLSFDANPSASLSPSDRQQQQLLYSNLLLGHTAKFQVPTVEFPGKLTSISVAW
jgi:hypothetical protein